MTSVTKEHSGSHSSTSNCTGSMRGSLLFMAAMLSTADAFVAHQHPQHNQFRTNAASQYEQQKQQQQQHPGWIHRQPEHAHDQLTSKLQATVYSPDGSSQDFSSEDSTTSTFSAGPMQLDHLSPRTQTLLETLQEQYRASLVKVACAFAPTGHVLKPKEVEAIQVLDLGRSSIEISAVLCEDQGCVSVAVPVDFPMPCQNEEDMELCVLDNISRLDSQAENVIATAEWKEINYEEVDSLERIRTSLMDKTNVALPSWWLSPESASYEMKIECRTFCDLLNEEDFRDDITTVARNALKTSQNIIPSDVCQSAVVEVGPAGLLMRAHIKQEKTFADESGYRIVDVQIPFVNICVTESELRASILSFVS